MGSDLAGQPHDLVESQTSEVSHEPAVQDEETSQARTGWRMGAEWRRWFWDAAPIAITYPIFLGALGFLNTWDFPIHVFIVALAWGLGRWIQGRRLEAPPTSIWLDATIALIACGLLGVVAYLPFYIGFRSQAAGIVPNLYNPTRLPQFFVMFGPWLLIGAAFILALLIRAVRQRRLTHSRAVLGSLGGALGLVAGAALLTAAVTLVFLLVSESAQAKLDEGLAIIEAQGLSVGQMLVARLGDLWTPLLLGAAMAVIVLLLRTTARGDRQPETDGESDAGPFTLMLFGVGALLAFAVEFVYLLDQFGTRMNTVFKLYYQAWAIWGVAAAYAVYHLWQSSERLTSAVSRVGFAGLAAISIVAGVVYPALAIQSGTVGRPIAPTLDASAPTREVYAPDEAAAIDWLERNADGTAVILETEGQSYRDNTSRVSAWSGVPSVLGWVGHEGQWRGNYDDIAPRQPDIDRIYNTTDSALALALMQKYNVVYVYVGPNEAAKYPPQGLAKFNAIMEVAFQRGNSTLYRLPEASRADTLSTR
jgi:YYY domain-containing protein